jgi:hypothetical protein
MSAICRSHVGVQGKADKKRLEKAAEVMRRIEDGEEDGGAALATFPLLAARRQIEPHRAIAEKALEEFAKQLPIAHVVAATKGLGFLGLAGIVGEAGAVGEYRSVSGLWKRFGVGVINGERQGRRTDKLEALEHGFAPARRAVMWNVGNQLIGAMGRGPRPLVGEDVSKRDDWSPWQRMFVQWLRYEADRDPEHRRPDNEKNGDMVESFSKHAAARAKRYFEKAFLILWCEWRRAAAPDHPSPQLQSDAAHTLIGAHAARSRAGRRPMEETMPRQAAAGATNSKRATHTASDAPSSTGRARRQPRTGSKPKAVTAGATNLESAIQQAPDAHRKGGRVRRRPSTAPKPRLAAAGATNSQNATQIAPDAQSPRGRARHRPTDPSKPRTPAAGATNSTVDNS